MDFLYRLLRSVAVFVTFAQIPAFMASEILNLTGLILFQVEVLAVLSILSVAVSLLVSDENSQKLNKAMMALLPVTTLNLLATMALPYASVFGSAMSLPIIAVTLGTCSMVYAMVTTYRVFTTPASESSKAVQGNNTKSASAAASSSLPGYEQATNQTKHDLPPSYEEATWSARVSNFLNGLGQLLGTVLGSMSEAAADNQRRARATVIPVTTNARPEYTPASTTVVINNVNTANTAASASASAGAATAPQGKGWFSWMGTMAGKTVGINKAYTEAYDAREEKRAAATASSSK